MRTPGRHRRQTCTRRLRINPITNGMRRWIGSLATVVLLLGHPALGAAMASDCTPRVGAVVRAAEISALVDQINGVGLTQAAPAAGPWPFTSSPLSTWYSRFVVSLGASSPPNASEQVIDAALTRELIAPTGRTFVTRIWVNDHGTAFRSANADLVHTLICGESATLSWPMTGESADAVDSAMKVWLSSIQSESSSPVRDTDGFLKTLAGSATIGAPHSDHPLNVITAFLTSGAFDAAIDAWPGMVNLPYYDDGKVRGLRLDDRGSGVSIYLFSASDADRGAFQKQFFSFDNSGKVVPSYAASRWKAIVSKFSAKEFNLLPLSMSIYGRSFFDVVPFADVQDSERYGNTVATSYHRQQGVEQIELHINGSRFSFAALSGIEGSNEPLILLTQFWPYPQTDFVRGNGFLYYVVDTRTGVIVGYGQEK